EDFENPYRGPAANGAHVLGYWTFDSEDDLRGQSRHRHPFRLQGAKRTTGKTEGGIESFPGYPVSTEKHSAVVSHHPALSPQGKFTIEMWIKPKPEFVPTLQAFLVDKKYVAHQDYQWTLSPANGQGQRRMRVNLGFGRDSASFTSQFADYSTNDWTHVAFNYDGAGKVTFFHNGALNGQDTQTQRGAIYPGKYELSIGDRRGSNYGGFPGYIDQVRICSGALEFRPLVAEFISERDTFIRMEKGATTTVRFSNLKGKALANVAVQLELGGKTKSISIPSLKSSATNIISLDLDTRLRPGTYPLTVSLSHSDGKWTGSESFPITIVPRTLPHRMPVVMWGLGSASAILDEMERVTDIGFTHCLGLQPDNHSIYQAGKPIPATRADRIAENKRMLNRALANDVRVVANLIPGRWARSLKEFQRLDRKGNPYGRHDVVGLHPKTRDFCENVGRSMVNTYGDFPAFDAAMIHTEVRGESQVSFTPIEVESYRKASGRGIPPEVRIKNGVEYRKLKNFPKDRIIADDNPILDYYRWFWADGDGWNDLHSAVHRGLNQRPDRKVWTFHDPAVRTTSVFGSGGSVNFLSQWTYSYPEPIRIGTATDELFTMTEGAKNPQGVMKMTQIIWYRSQTAPITKPGRTNAAPQSEWEDKDPDAAYITIAPMHLREAFWTKLSRPIQGIMYHGWQSLVKGKVPYAYRFTHPQTQHELKRLIHEVVHPLGPTLKQIPDRLSDVAYLQSFASQMFARRGTYGWNYRWSGDGYLVAQYAQLQPRIVYEQSILRDGLDHYKMLFLFDCDVLPKSVADRIKSFQEQGGIVIGDENLAPRIKADITIQSFKRPKQADEAKKLLHDRAAQLTTKLEGRYQRFAKSDNPEVITRARQFGPTDYVFAINDHREFGDYVGQHGLVMENGLPSDARIQINRRQGHAYNLRTGQPVPTTGGNDSLIWPVNLGPAEGGLFMITPRPIDRLKLNGPESARRGESVKLSAVVADSSGEPVSAIVPIHLQIRDTTGRELEFSGHYGAKNGKLEVEIDIAPNDEIGLWEIIATELASRQSSRHYLRIKQRSRR
ncbi:MAG: LamG domain-containing protein, partial [Limisphaerales bacterium]